MSRLIKSVTNPPPTGWSPSDRKTINIKQAMVLCGVSRRTIYNWLQSKKVFYVRTAGGAVRIFAESLFRGVRAPSESVSDNLLRSHDYQELTK